MKARTEGHCLHTIRDGLDQLDPTQLRHIEDCRSCRREYEVYQRLEQAIRNLPIIQMPAAVRNRILDQVLLPGYRLRHLAVALAFACLTPIMLLVFDVRQLFGPGLTLSLFGGCGILIVLLIMPMTHYLLLRHRLDVDSLKHRLDTLLARR